MTTGTAVKRMAPAKKRNATLAKASSPSTKTTRTAIAAKAPARVPKAPAKRKTPAKAVPAARAKPIAPKKPPMRQSARSAATKAASDATGVIRTLAGISTSAVAKATGHGWTYWLRALDRAGAATLPHREIVKLLGKSLGVRSPWWLQMITVGYEQARGLRKPNQQPRGFVASVSRTVAVPLNALYAAWQEGKRGDWLPDAIEVRRVTKNKSMKITWPDGSGIDVSFYDKGGHKAVVAIEQAQLPDPGAVATVKSLWGSTLDRLKATLEGKV